MSPASTRRFSLFGWSGYQLYALILLCLVSVLNTMDRGALSLLQEHIKRDLALSDLQLGLLSGPFFAVFYSFAGLPVARLSEHFARNRILAGCIAFWSGATMLCAAAANFWQLAIFRAGVGIGEGGANPISHSLVAEKFPARQRGMAMSILSAAIPAGMVITPLLIGFVAQFYGWRVALLVAGAPGIVLAPLVLWTLREPRTGKAKQLLPNSFKTDIGYLFGNKAFRWIFAAAAFNGIGISGTGIFTPPFLLREYGLNIAEAGTVLALAGGMGLLGTFIGGYAADRFADERGRSYVLVPAAGAALSFVFFALAFRSPEAWLGVALILVANVVTDLKNGPNWAAVQNVSPSNMRATASAVFFLAATVLGAGLGGLLVGGFSDLMATRSFDLGVMQEMCVGGVGREGLGASVDAACRAAASYGLRTALGILPVTFLGAAICFYIASRTITVNRD